MASRSRSHLSDASLRRSLAAHLTAENASCAEFLADLGEMDARGLFREDGYTSMHEYCVREFRFTPGRAYKRLHVARKARRFPLILDLIADGKLGLSGVMLLAGHLREHNARELLAEAAGKAIAEIERLLARRFPKPDEPTRIEVLSSPPDVAGADEPSSLEMEPTRPGIAPSLSTWKVKTPQVVGILEPASAEPSAGTFVPDSTPPAPARDAATVSTRELSTWKVPVAAEPSRVKPLAPERYSLKTTIDQTAHDDLRRAQDLLRGRVQAGDVGEVLKRALRLLVQDLEKRKFGATERPKRRPAKASRNPRYIPKEIKRAVYARDKGQCTFVGKHGQRCQERGASLQFDHQIPVCQGGESDVGNLRLRCHAHNQLAAEQLFGADFIRHKREAAREAASKARPRPGQATTAATPAAPGSRP